MEPRLVAHLPRRENIFSIEGDGQVHVSYPAASRQWLYGPIIQDRHLHQDVPYQDAGFTVVRGRDVRAGQKEEILI